MSVGTSSAKYHPIATLGHGGMASVLLTVMQGGAGIHKLLVMKKIRPELTSDAEFMAMFLDEARLAARLSHPNVVQTYEVGESEAGPFIVMEYLEGQSLSGLLARVGRKTFPLPLHLLVLRGILAGLGYAHELADYDGTPLHVVHRDVSPQNAFVCYDGRVKLVDFGIAKAAGVATQTREGVFKGKMGYMAPEQMLAAEIDRRADLFSLGIMMWEALTGKRFTQGDTEAAVMWKRTRGELPRLENAPSALAAVCLKALAFSPDDRFASAHEMIDALDEALRHEGMAPLERELGALITRAFQDEREKIRGVIETQLATVRLSGSFPRALPSLAGEMASSSVPPVGADTAAALLPSAAPAELPTQFTAVDLATPARRRGLGPMVGAVSALVLLLGGIGVAAFVVRRVPAEAGVAKTARATSEPPVAARAAPAPAVTYHLTVTPKYARAELDGQELKDLSSVVVPRGETRKLRITAPQRAPKEQTLASTSDMPSSVDLSVDLALAVPARPVIRGPAADPLDVDLKKGPKGTRKIDETDPYGR